MAVAGPLKNSVKEGLEELIQVMNLCHSLGVKKLKWSPLMAMNYDWHKGGTFFESGLLKGKTREVIAAGGRYVFYSLRGEGGTDRGIDSTRW